MPHVFLDRLLFAADFAAAALPAATARPSSPVCANTLFAACANARDAFGLPAAFFV
jgi:hypothetical protein